MLTVSEDTTADRDVSLRENGAFARLERNRFLQVMGAGLFGFATQMVLRTAPAEATHVGTPYGCYGYPRCHCCSGVNCCGDCHYHSGGLGCESQGQCWNNCAGGNMYRCCDWHEIVGSRHSACICASDIGNC